MNKQALEGSLGEYRGCVYRFNNFDEYREGGIHTFSIVKDKRSNVFYGYSGPSTHGAVSLWKSSNLSEWERIKAPLYRKKGIRWPTAVKREDTTDVLVQQRNGILNRAVNKTLGNNSLCQAGYWRIDWYSQCSGSLTFNRTLIDQRSNKFELSSNPYLIKDDDHVLLTYFGKRNNKWFIITRKSESIKGLSKAKNNIIKCSDSLLAAPSLIKHPSTGKYILLAERVDNNSGKWITTMSIYNDIYRDDDGSNETIVFEEDIACPFFFVERDRNDIYLFVSQRTKEEQGSMLSGKWLGHIYKFDADKLIEKNDATQGKNKAV
jgi:hypothetical protein